jgi:hypothetical protein
VSPFGDGLVVRIYNVNPHIGAVAVGDWDGAEQRASVSVMTRLGHKDDALAQMAAHAISKTTRRPCCVVAGVHLDDINLTEIKQVLKNAEGLVEEYLTA